MLSLGLVKYIAPDKSHGFLLEIQPEDIVNSPSRLSRQKGNLKFWPPKDQECTEGDILCFDAILDIHGTKRVKNPSRSIYGFVLETEPGIVAIAAEFGNIEDDGSGDTLVSGAFVELNLHLKESGLNIKTRVLNNERVFDNVILNIANILFQNAFVLPGNFLSFFENYIQHSGKKFCSRLALELQKIPIQERLKLLPSILNVCEPNSPIYKFLTEEVVNQVPEEIIPLYAEGFIDSSEIASWLLENPEIVVLQPANIFEQLFTRLRASSHFTEIAVGALHAFREGDKDKRVYYLLSLLSEKWQELSPEQWFQAIVSISDQLPVGLMEELWNQNEQTAISLLSSIPANDLHEITKNNPGAWSSKALWNRKWQIDMEHLPICIFDFEIRRGKIEELAWSFQFEEEVFKGEKNVMEQGLSRLLLLIHGNPSIVLAGHNIREFDLPALRKQMDLPDDLFIFDTLEIAAVCAPARRNYQLRTAHNALEDVRLTQQLLKEQLHQLLQLDEYSWTEIKAVLPNPVANLLAVFRGKVFPDTIVQTDFFQKEVENQLLADLQNHLAAIKDEGQTHLLAPLECQGWLSRLPNVLFQNPDNSLDNGFLTPDKIKARLPNDRLLRAALLNYVFESEKAGRLPLMRLLSPWIRLRLTETLVDPSCITHQINPSDWQGLICWQPLDYLDGKPVEGKAIALSPSLYSLSAKKLVAKLPSEKSEELSNQYWMRFAGNNGRAPLDKSEAELLAASSINSNYDVFWLERSGISNEIFLWGSLSAKNWKQFLESEDIQRLEDEKSEAKFGIVTVSDSSLSRASIDRLNPDSPYRAPYWLLQTRLLDGLFAGETVPVVLVLREAYELDRLTTWLRSQGWYVPDENCSIFRRLELLHSNFSRKRMLPITVDKLSALLEANYLAPVFVVVDSLDLRPWQFMTEDKSTIDATNGVLSDESDNEEDVKSDVESNDEGEPLLERYDLHGIIQQFYPWLDWMGKMATSFIPGSQLAFLDVRLADHVFPKKINPKIHYGSLPWSNQDVYLQDLENIVQFGFSAAIREEESAIYENCKNAIEAALLGGNQLYDYQEDYLRSIAQRRESLVISLPTGGGKSVLFQGPALYRSSTSNRLSLVVTPLKALMEDQVEGLWRKKFWACVDAISGDMTQEEVRHVLRRVAGGEVLLLYLTPERFRSRAFIRSFTTRLVYDKDLEYCVFDEAHCISQWGNEFRPAYLSAARTVREWQIGRQLPCLFLSATISDQVYGDIQHIFNGQPNPADSLRITRLQHQEFYNPVREHIQLTFKKAKPADRINEIARFLLQNDFNSTISRALVFVNSRRETEELAEAFEEQVKGKIRAGFFHAGMSSGDREEAFGAFKSGEVALLFATKAFGMGMDVPNIHFVFHYEPSSTIEDFLQEVGRAGRDPKSLEAVNFSSERPLTTVCLYEADDFGKLFDRIQHNSIAWEDIRELQKLLLDYFRRIQYPQDRPAPVSARLMNQSPTLKNHKQKSALISLGMHWLEKLGRFKVGMYTPDAFAFDAAMLAAPITGDAELDDLLAYLNQLKAESEGCTLILAGAVDVAKKLKVQPGDSTEVSRRLFLAQKQGYLCLKNDLPIAPIKGKGEFRLKEIKSWKDDGTTLPLLDAAFELQENILSLMRPQGAVAFSGKEMDDLVKQVMEAKMQAARFTWIDPDNRVKFAEASEKHFSKNKVKYAVGLFSWFEKVKHRSRMKEGQTSQTFILERVEKESLRKELETFQQQCRLLLRLVYNGFLEGQSLFDWHKLLDELELEDISRLEKLLVFLKRMGYVQFEGSTLPFAIEVYQTETSSAPIDHRNPRSPDCRVYEDEFLENQKLRILRLAALQTLAHLSEERGRAGTDEFIQRYFTCKSAADVIDLLEEYLHEGHPVLQAIKEEALQYEESRLHESQLKVYDADLQRNLNVIAGPGSGKTHTLVIRVARLIHRERVAPGQILVLAYNRAVVTELKDRLSRLFARLGYKNLARGLRVFTFHGLMKYCLQENADGIELKDYASHFTRLYDRSPGEIRARLGNIRFVLVDEFQDITSERLAVLHRIAPPQSVAVTVIGDPDQSIYGFERANLMQPVPPKPYYKDFAKLYNPDMLELTINYRSFPQIVGTAKELLALNPTDFSATSLEFFQQSKSEWALSNRYVEVLEAQQAPWENKLLELLSEQDEKGQPYGQIALMFRTNNEVFRAYAKINQQGLPAGVRLRIQGSSANFSRLREVHEFLVWIKPHLNQTLPDDFLQRFRGEFWSTHVLQVWDKFTLHTLEAVLIEFLKKEKQETSTYADLARFIDEFAWRDDGQLNKIYQLHREEITNNHSDVAQSEVVLTTMHRVKGLEYDAVLIPPSYYELSVWPGGNMAFEDMLYEERRLWYVAMTRAKKRLVWIQWQREQALQNGIAFSLPEELRQQIGVGLEDGIDKINIGFLPWLDANSFQQKNAYIEQNIRTGDAIRLMPTQNGGTSIRHNGNLIGMLKSGLVIAPPNGLSGYIVTNVIRYTYEDCLDYDQRHSDNRIRYADNWNPAARQLGYVSIADFAGYGR